jgi:hypothetical protein
MNRRIVWIGVASIAAVVAVGAVSMNAEGSSPTPPDRPAWSHQDGSVDPNATTEVLGQDGQPLKGPDGKPIKVKIADLMAPPSGPGGHAAPQAPLWPGQQPSHVISRKVTKNPDGSSSEVVQLGP